MGDSWIVEGESSSEETDKDVKMGAELVWNVSLLFTLKKMIPGLDTLHHICMDYWPCD